METGVLSLSSDHMCLVFISGTSHQMSLCLGSLKLQSPASFFSTNVTSADVSLSHHYISHPVHLICSIRRLTIHWTVVMSPLPPQVSILKTISVMDPDSINVVKFLEQFEYLGQTCLAFEMLEANLEDLVKRNNGKPLHLKEIRPIAKQVVTSVEYRHLSTAHICNTSTIPQTLHLSEQ